MAGFIWTADAGVLVARDELGIELVRVKTGGTHWNFQFTGIGGNGRVRVGAGCDYNPLGLIQEMFNQVVRDETVEPPTGDLRFQDGADHSDEFVREWG